MKLLEDIYEENTLEIGCKEVKRPYNLHYTPHSQNVSSKDPFDAPFWMIYITSKCGYLASKEIRLPILSHSLLKIVGKVATFGCRASFASFFYYQ